MAVLRLKLLGGFEARLASGEQAQIPIRKGQALLAYLALKSDLSAPRTVLASLLWGDHGETQAQTSLRQTLTVLRKALAPAQDQILRTDRQSVALGPDGIDVDARRFRALADSEAPEDLEEAIALFSGDLLYGIEIRDPEFEAWLEDERRQFRELMAGTLAALIAHKRVQGATTEALALAQRWLAMDSLQERVHRLLMEVYAELGQRDAVLRQFQRCREVLESELGVEPAPETQELYRALCDNGFGARESADFARRVPPRRVPDETLANEQSDDAPRALSRLRSWRRTAVGAFALSALMAAAGLLWMKPWALDVEPASRARMAYPLPDRPSIAVLPFDNMSGDPNQDYFTDGLTDDLITDLSKIDGLFVIARNSTFAYKGQTVNVRQVAEELGVRYVLEGSVRRAGDQIRINTQLIDTTTGGHVWAERYDKALTEIFELQDQVTAMVVSALEVHLTSNEIERQARRATNSPEAYDAWLRGKVHVWAYTREDYVSAIANFRKAVEIDPEYATAQAWLAGTYLDLWSNDWQSILGLSEEEVLEKVKHHLEEAMKDPSTPGIYHVRSRMLSDEKRFDEAIGEAEKMLVLSPNSVEGLITLGRALNKAGRFSECLEIMKKAVRLDPKGSEFGWYDYRIGESQFHTERYSEAAESFKAYTEKYSNEEWGYFYLAASYGQMGRLEEAKNALDTFEDIRSESGHKPQTLSDIDGWTFKYDADRERLREGLRRAGVPE